MQLELADGDVQGFEVFGAVEDLEDATYVGVGRGMASSPVGAAVSAGRRSVCCNVELDASHSLVNNLMSITVLASDAVSDYTRNWT
jgi:hypothetical protein